MTKYLEAGCNLVIRYPLMVSEVVGSIPHGGTNELFLQPVFYSWCNKDHGVYYAYDKSLLI